MALTLLPLYVDMPRIWGHVLPAAIPVAVGLTLGFIARKYIARQRREESIISRQRGAR